MPRISYANVIRRSTGEVLFQKARWCSSHLCRLRGLQFRSRLEPGEALILVHGHDSVSTSSIHMFFVPFAIAAVWIDSSGKVTSAQLAKPWRPYYASPQPARYVLETSPAFLEKVQVGEELDFILVKR